MKIRGGIHMSEKMADRAKAAWKKWTQGSTTPAGGVEGFYAGYFRGYNDAAQDVLELLEKKCSWETIVWLRAELRNTKGTRG